MNVIYCETDPFICTCKDKIMLLLIRIQIVALNSLVMLKEAFFKFLSEIFCHKYLLKIFITNDVKI